jgi:hypothetical protein
MEDNGSGTALVIELARVMSQFTFDKTIVFMTTTGEEQGLHGAEAVAFYCKFDEPLIDVKAVLNNDVIGGIICGATSSEPSCPGENLIDSTQVRLFSRGNFDSPHKSLSRYIKLQYQQELLPYVQVPMLLTLMSAEDRTGRGEIIFLSEQKIFLQCDSRQRTSMATRVSMKIITIDSTLLKMYSV